MNAGYDDPTINLSCADILYSLKIVDGDSITFTVAPTGDLYIQAGKKEICIEESHAKTLRRFLEFAMSESAKKEAESDP